MSRYSNCALCVTNYNFLVLVSRICTKSCLSLFIIPFYYEAYKCVFFSSLNFNFFFVVANVAANNIILWNFIIGYAVCSIEIELCTVNMSFQFLYFALFFFFTSVLCWSQFKYSGQVSELHANQKVYLSLIDDYRKTSRVYLDQIIQTTIADSLGFFTFEM